MGNNLAIFGGSPVRTKPFKYEPAIGKEEKEAVLFFQITTLTW